MEESFEAEEPLGAEAAAAEAEAETEEPAGVGPQPAVPTAMPDISVTDPKVVIEPVAPAASGQAEAGHDVSTLEPPREKEADDQPKRRGWWNRFV